MIIGHKKGEQESGSQESADSFSFSPGFSRDFWWREEEKVPEFFIYLLNYSWLLRVEPRISHMQRKCSLTVLQCYPSFVFQLSQKLLRLGALL